MKYLDHYNKTKKEVWIEVRPLTFEEMKSLKYGDVLKALSNDGKLVDIRVASRVKTWKRNPSRVEISFKYGLYESVRWDQDTIQERVFKEV